jgi:hypothetical protein
MTETTTDAATGQRNDGMNVVDAVHPSDWANYPTETKVGEYVHVFIDREQQEMRCYLTRNEGYPNERVKTTIPGVRFKPTYRNGNDKTLQGFFLTFRNAESFMSFVDLMTKTREPGTTVTLKWGENNTKPAHEDDDVNHETINFSWSKCNGMRRHIEISDTYSLCDYPEIRPEFNQMARYQEDSDNE